MSVIVPMFNLDQSAAKRVMLGLVAVVGLIATAAPAAAQSGSPGYVGSFGNWEGHIYPISEDETRCAVRSVHPAIVEGEIHWVFNTRHADRLPDGFLAVDPRLLGDAADVSVVVDDRARFALKRGRDGTGYSRDGDAAALLAAMRRGLEMQILIDARDGDRAGERRVLMVSLIGFSRGSDAVGAYCRGAVRRTLG